MLIRGEHVSHFSSVVLYLCAITMHLFETDERVGKHPKPLL